MHEGFFRREIARSAHQRATDVIAGLRREIAELKKENEALAANVKPKVAIEELETRLSKWLIVYVLLVGRLYAVMLILPKDNAGLGSLRATND